MTDARDAWIRDATDWIVATTDELGLGPHTAITAIRERIWGAVLRVEMADRALFFKAEGAGARHEPAILADIAAIQPALVPDLIAVDLERAWLLMEDNGSPMRDSTDAHEEVEIWEGIFPLYASMQRSSVSNIARWIDAGTPDRRLELLPSLVERLLAEPGVPFDPERRRAVASTLKRLEEVCEELSGGTESEGIDHSDMHGRNVLVGERGPRLVDWGDACITHPFVSPFVTYQHAVARLPASDRPAATFRLRDVYLEAWSNDTKELRGAFAKATWLGHVVRALNFRHQLGQPSEWGDDVAKFLGRWHEQSGLLGRGDELIMTVANQAE